MGLVKYIKHKYNMYKIVLAITMLDTTEAIIVNSIVLLCIASIANYSLSFLSRVIYG